MMSDTLLTLLQGGSRLYLLPVPCFFSRCLKILSVITEHILPIHSPSSFTGHLLECQEKRMLFF